jgi:hypothetical protein
MDLSIPSNEHGLIRVFALNRSPAELSLALKTLSKTALASDLLGHDIAAGGAELFPVADLSGIGLSGYLADGYAVPMDQLKETRTKLDALEGYVLLVFSAAFEGHAVTLTPGPDLTLIGTFGETQPDMAMRAVESEAAQPYTGAPSATPPIPPKGRAGGSLVSVGLIVLVALILWWAFR